MLGGDDAVNAAADAPRRLHHHPLRATASYHVVENAIGDVLVENALVTKALQIDLETLQLDAFLISHVGNSQGCEIGLTGLRTHAGELMDVMFNKIIP